MRRNAVILAVVAGCSASTSLPSVRFANAPPARAVNDRLDVAQKPAQREFLRLLYNLDGQFVRRVSRPLELRRPQRALGVNALDEVPDSTWFTNRVGARDVSPDEIAAAPGGVGSPEPHKPWTVVSTKQGGQTLGFIIRDARGEKFLMKFDVPGQPEGETATHIIVGKLMWGFGLNVTEDYVAYVRADELVLAENASIVDALGNKRPLTRDELARRITNADLRADGSIRVLVSSWLAGKPLGGHPGEGVRADDLNDRIPHELRRDLRGLYALFSWLDHIDVHGGNMLDVYVPDPDNARRHYVMHYWIDYGIALGYGARKNEERRYGYEWYMDYAQIARNLVTFGVIDRGWEPRQPQHRRGVGMLETTLYDPGNWVSSSPAYVPVYVADRFDKFWASKIIIRFTRDHIRAAVDAARLSDPDAATWLTDALIARQRATAAYWFARVNPLDRFIATSNKLCFDDLAIVYAFAPAASTTYTLTAFTPENATLAEDRVVAGASGVTCGPLSLGPGADRYTIVRVTTKRPAFAGRTYVHVALDPATRAPRVIGIWRE
jgi:hypothetical protein